MLGAATYFYKAKQTLPFKVRVHGPCRSPLNWHRAVPPASSVVIIATEEVLRSARGLACEKLCVPQHAQSCGRPVRPLEAAVCC